jgi:hypothetical protein
LQQSNIQGQSVHALFCLDIDECQSTRFLSHISRRTVRADYLLSADLIIIDEVSMLTPWVTRRALLTLGSIAEGNHGKWDFGAAITLCRRSFAIASSRSKHKHAGIEKGSYANSLLDPYSQIYIAGSASF